MNRVSNHLEQVDLIGKLADLKNAHYHNALLVSTIIELLVEKEIITAKDIAVMSARLDASYSPNPHQAHPTP
jgi:transcriptional regulator CtsR